MPRHLGDREVDFGQVLAVFGNCHVLFLEVNYSAE